ncbi:hypothetical protein JKP75_18655 [Blastococcus sp. TML/M2B]|uniref:hypothetical protein n=1 Tax=Blastococcus sp. TML/M2B TaxID=2798727 RepID=UPI00190C0940|nr:hypothetical protein [Blastococcus sp. TML/M2B]MBN1094385.1 hypothetical protein [Blastococcus sp. TML/M2B]
MERVADGQTPGPPPALAAVKTYRYLRLAMVAVVVGLGVAVVHEVLRVEGTCWQTSLSGYYYTPVQNVLVGALVAIGLCLVALKGSTDVEDVLLNVAGVCAPFVAVVPIAEPGSCGVVTDGLNRNLNVANNVTAVLAVVGIALATLAVLWMRNRSRTTEEPPPTRIELLGYAGSVLLFGAAAGVFALRAEAFDRYGHAVAAITMFVLVVADVAVNAVNLHRGRRGTHAPVRRMNRYAWIVLGMVGFAAASGVLGLLGVEHWLLVLEAGLIGCFGVFWGLQTVELWNQGLRPAPPAAPPAEAPTEASTH